MGQPGSKDTSHRVDMMQGTAVVSTKISLVPLTAWASMGAEGRSRSISSGKCVSLAPEALGFREVVGAPVLCDVTAALGALKRPSYHAPVPSGGLFQG